MSAGPTDVEAPPTLLRALAMRAQAIGRNQRQRRIALLALALVYVAAWAISGLWPLNPTDMDVFFLPAARIALNGDPLHIYAVRYEALYPNANGPLSLLPLTFVAAVARLLGWLDTPPLRRILVLGAFAIFPLLMGLEAVRAVQRLVGRPVGRIWRLLTIIPFICTPILWEGMMGYGHVEQAMMLWLALVGVRLLSEGKSVRAGVLLGLALLTRTSALVYIIPLAGVLLRRGRWRQSAQFAGVAGGVTLVGLAPFLLADRDDTLFSLVTFRSALPVGGFSFWGTIVGSRLEPFAQHYDSLVIVGAAVVVTALVALAQRGLDVDSVDIYALLALCSLCFALFIKTLWPYYFLETYVFALIWWLAQAGMVTSRRGWALWALGGLTPVSAIALAALVDYGLAISVVWETLHTWSLWVSVVALTAATAQVIGMILAVRARRQRTSALAHAV